MTRFPGLALGLLLCSATTLVVAEQRFYQVIDAQGHMQTILAPEEVKPSSTPDPSGVSGSSSKSPASDPAEPSDQVKGKESLPPRRPTDAAPPSLDADDEYIDSELLDKTNFNPKRKKRFYILNDGAGTRVEESDGQLTGMTEQGSASSLQTAVKPFRTYDADPHDVVDGKDLQKLLSGKALCLSKKTVLNVPSLAKGIPAAVTIDKKTRLFVGAGGLVKAFRVEGPGLRKIQLRSYSRSEKIPGFVMPVVALADDNGCVIRAVTDGYFERWYMATKMRHPTLEGGLTMMSAERFLLVIVPDQEAPRSSQDFPRTDDGEFAIQWHD